MALIMQVNFRSNYYSKQILRTIAMNKNIIALAVSAILLSGNVSANNMYINLPNNTYDATRSISSGGIPFDANTQTAVFTEFGYSQLLATSIYDYSDGSVLGSFFDTNIPAELTAAGVPASGTAIDGSTPVSIVTPNCPAGQCDLDALSPLVPPLGTDNEGFLQTWDLQVAYHFDGTLTAGGPIYTGGTFEVFFNDLNNNANDRSVIRGTLVSSTLNAANLDLFFNITYSELGFLFLDDGTGNYRDANQGGTLHLDTNVNPPIPTADQLLLVNPDGPVGPNLIRQTTLDGSVTGTTVPEPSSIALLGLGLIGFSWLSRRKKV